MGDRAQIKITEFDESVYLYTHWGASELVNLVIDVLRRNERWNDGCYLARMFFSKMIEDSITGTTGYGICTSEHSDIWRLIHVNVDDQKISLRDFGEVVYEGTFEHFIDDEKREAIMRLIK